jgi:D-serine deaminase-like pyridoxal phosphate-dependent protein
LGQEGFCLIREAPEAMISTLSEEHGIVDLIQTDWRPQIGDEISIIPNRVCVVSNLFDSVLLNHPNGQLEEVSIPVRGQLR